MTLKLTREQRKVKRLIDKLWRDGVKDEHNAVAFYRTIAKEFRDLGYSKEAKILDTIMEHEQIHKDILNEMIKDLEREVIWKKYLKGGK